MTTKKDWMVARENDLDNKLGHWIRHITLYHDNGNLLQGYSTIPYFWGFLNMEGLDHVPFRVYLIGDKNAHVYDGVSDTPCTLENWMERNPSLPGFLRFGKECVRPDTISLFFAINNLNDILMFKNRRGEGIFANFSLRIEGINYNYRSLMADREKNRARYVFEMSSAEMFRRGISLTYDTLLKYQNGTSLDYTPDAIWGNDDGILLNGYTIPYDKDGIKGELQVFGDESPRFVEYEEDPKFVVYPMLDVTRERLVEIKRKIDEMRQRISDNNSERGDISETRAEVAMIRNSKNRNKNRNRNKNNKGWKSRNNNNNKRGKPIPQETKKVSRRRKRKGGLD